MAKALEASEHLKLLFNLSSRAFRCTGATKHTGLSFTRLVGAETSCLKPRTSFPGRAYHP